MAFKYAPPAGQNDLAGQPNEQAYLDQWSEHIARNFRREIEGLEEVLGQTPLFFSELDQALPAGVPTAPVPWVGFPRALLLAFPGDRQRALAAADELGEQVLGFTSRNFDQEVKVPFRQQDEYLEWVPLKQAGETVGFAFTAEGPEYWEHLAEMDREAVRKLYESFAGRPVQWSELAWQTDVWVNDEQQGPVQLYKRDDYNPFNSVNMLEVAAHLTHPANTLGAEIDLAAKATVQRKDASGATLSERRRLACCSNFGDPNRNSDPTIGLAVNLTVRGGVSLTLADPVGLYIRAFDENRIADDAGNPLPGFWSLKRGATGRGLRAEFKPPAGSPLKLANVRVGNNELLSRGGQLAELTTMVLYARATSLGVAEPTAQRCVAHCCVKKGAAPDQSLLDQVARGRPCAEGFNDAFPELTQLAMDPFTRRSFGTMGRRMRDGG